MHFLDTFLIGIIFEFRQKGEEHPLIDPLFAIKRRDEYVFISFVLFSTPLLMIDKKGEKNLSLYACLYACFMFLLSSFGIVCMFYVFIKFIWYQSIIYKTCLFLVSRACKRDHQFYFAYIKFNWLSRTCLFVFDLKISLVSRASLLFIHIYACFMFSIHCIYLLFIPMHELRGSFFEA